MYTDPIADMLTRIRNASQAKLAELTMPYSKLKENLAKLLLAEGFIAGVDVKGTGIKSLHITLKYEGVGNPVISGIERVSKPGQRIYLPVDKLPRTNGGFGVTVVSTSKGLLPDREARKQRLGGEVICQIW
jgi:small subunit ribosomal protein S8